MTIATSRRFGPDSYRAAWRCPKCGHACEVFTATTWFPVRVFRCAPCRWEVQQVNGKTYATKDRANG